MPNVKGGAVEYLIQLLIDENEKNWHEQFTVYSIYVDGIEEAQEKYKYCRFVNIKSSSVMAKIGTAVRYVINTRIKYIGNYYISRVFKELGKRINDYDVVIDENAPDFLPLIRKVYDGRLIFHAHNDWFEKSDFEQLNCCDEYWSVSRYLADKIISEKIKCDVHVLYNGIQLKDYTAADKALTDEYTERFHIGIQDIVIVYAGRIVPEKGVYQMIRSFMDAGFSDDVKLLIAGGAFYSDEKVTPYMNQCRELAQGNANIIFAGYIPGKEMAGIYALGHIGVVPSIWQEPFGLTVLEMMAAGLPVITTTNGAIPEIADENTAFLCSTDNEKQWICDMTLAMKKLVENAELRNRMGNDGKERCAIFSEGRYLSTFITLLYRKLREE